MKFDGTLHQVAWNLEEHPWENYVSSPQFYIPQQDLTVDIIGPDQLIYNETKEYIADINGGAGLYNIKWYLRDYPNGTFTVVKSTPEYPEYWESNYYKLYEPPTLEVFYFYDDEYRYNLTMQGHDVELKVVVIDYGYFFRLVTAVTGDAEYCLINAVNDAGTVAKRSFDKISFTGDKIPVTYDLSQNYPNPYNPATTINYQLPKTGHVTLKIYDILGKEVTTLVSEQKTQGRYSVNFNASSGSRRMASGVYIYQIRVNEYVSSKKMLLLK